MTEYGAEVTWHRYAAKDFLGSRYSRAHTWRFDGGLEVPASYSAHVVPLPCSAAGNVDPEEAFVSARPSCHLLWFLALAGKASFVVDG